MKTSKILLAILLTCSSFTAIYAQNEEKEQLTVPLTTPGKPGTLDVSLIRGSIHVKGYAGKEVIISAVPFGDKENSRKPEAPNGMKRLASSNSGIELTAEEDKNTVKVSTAFNKRPLNLTIMVPQQFTLKVKAINEGDVIIDNIQGEMEVTNINGDIKLTNISGSVVANTVNGNVKADFKAITESPMAFSTLNGNLDVTFPATAKFDIKIKSDRGEIFTDYDVAIQKAPIKSTTTSEKGMYKISKEDWVQGKINGGGGEVMMKNMNGNIFVRKTK